MNGNDSDAILILLYVSVLDHQKDPSQPERVTINARLYSDDVSLNRSNFQLRNVVEPEQWLRSVYISQTDLELHMKQLKSYDPPDESFRNPWT